jgi:arylsulfatase
MQNNATSVILFSLFLSISIPAKPQKQQISKPNILLIVADDLGYTDLGCYGGEIKTPNIDRLAKRGIQFTNFHTSPLCAPTRSMLFSGNDNHVAGMGSMFPVKGTSREGKIGYEQHLTDRIVTVSQLLKDGGYQTFITGKWHLGFEDAYIPFAKGFEKSFILLNGGANQFNNDKMLANEPPRYRLDSQVVLFPEGRFSTDVYTEKMLTFIRNGKKDKPFFACLTYTAPHWPLQVPADYIDKYKGMYDMGYDSLRVIRFNQQKKMGIIPPGATLPPRDASIKPWIQLSSEDKKLESRKMELYAAMVDNLDHHIGRLLQYLEESKQLDNTIIVFMSDNGAAAEDFYNRPDGPGPFLREHYDNSYDNMGKASSFVSYGPQWAQAGAAPFKLFKYYSTEGGIVAPLIFSGKYVERKFGLQNTFITVMDLAPTFLELAGIGYPVVYNNKKVTPMLGESCLPFVRGKANAVHSNNYVFGLEHDGQCLLIKGNWKITNISRPFDETAFALYNLSEDLGETTDLSRSNPKKFTEMMNEWKVFKQKTGVIDKRE